MANQSPLIFPVLSPGNQFAGYLIEEMVGRGGMGVVYRALDLTLDRTVALKVIAPQHTEDPAAVSRFKSEAKLAASVEHPNLVTIYGAGECDGVLFLAMRFVPGTDLQAVMRGHRALDLPRIRTIVDQLAKALDVAHAAGLIHRDVKPANILLTGVVPLEQVYLTDFGLTKRLGASTAGLTASGQWLGTPDYAAPEQIRGLGVDARTDVYSFGCVVHELVTGHRPYERDSAMATLWAHVHDSPASPCAHRPELLPVFDSLIAGATAKDPDERFSSAGALSQAFKEAVALQLEKEAHSAPEQVCAAEAATVDEYRDAPSPPSGNGESLAETESKAIVATSVQSDMAATGSDADALGSTVADRAPVTDAPRIRMRRLPLVAGLCASGIAVAVVVAIALSGETTTRKPPIAVSGATTAHRAAGAVTPAVLAQDVGRLNGIVELFIAGKHLSRVERKYAAAAQNRMLVLARLSTFDAPPQLRPAAGTLRRMTVDSLAFNADMARGEPALAGAPNNAHNALRGRFVDEFNPYAERSLGRTYTVNDF